MKVNVKKCERCGQDHDDLPFALLISPVIVGGEEYTHVGQCPETHERIFMVIVSLHEDMEHTRKKIAEGLKVPEGLLKEDQDGR